MKKLLLSVAAVLLLAASSQAQITDLHNFRNNDTNGAGPSGSLTLSGNKLYGMTSGGGANHDGVIFSIDTNGSGYKDLYDFDGTTGKYPEGSLTLSGNKLYGMTLAGGANTYGCIFSIDTNGSGYKDLYDFILTNGGGQPEGSLTLSGNILYGMAGNGGANGYGTIFSIDTAGSGYKDLYDFNITIGGGPNGSLTLSGNTLYGLTSSGGANSDGVIFSVNINGSGYKDLHDFTQTNIQWSTGSLTLSGNILYGMDAPGGAKDSGCIFSINTNGSGYKDLFDFNGTNDWSSLTLTGNLLYGMANSGGAKHDGVIFSIDTAGSGYKDLYNFDGTSGETPLGSLVLSGNVLYGMANNGGDGYGVIFSFRNTEISTSINELQTNPGTVNVYPNPNTGVFTISLQNISKKAKAELYNIMGEKVYEAALNQNVSQIDLSSQPEGLYLYRVITNVGNLVGEGKLLIEK